MSEPEFCNWDRFFLFFFFGLKESKDLIQAVVMFVTGIYRGLCLESVKNKYECEIQAACQHWEVRDGTLRPVRTLWLHRSLCDCRISASQSEKLLLFDTVQSELEEKIRRLEEDRHSIDITSGSTNSSCWMLSMMSFCPQILYIYTIYIFKKQN